MPEVASAPAPAAAPVAASAPAAKPAASPAASAPSNETFNSLSKYVDGGEKAANGSRKSAGTPPPEAVHEPGEETAFDDAAPPAKPEDTKPASGEAVKPKPEKAKTLREAYDHTKSENAKLQARIKELETAKPPEDPEKKQLAEKLTAREKRLQELEEDQRFTNYERSEDYKTQWEKPFIDAYQAGRNKIASFRLANEDGTTRNGAPEDFDKFMQIQDDNDAADAAHEMFGNRAPIAMYHREQVQQKNSARNAALDEFRKNGAEREKVRQETMTKQQKAVYEEANTTWKKLVTEPLEKFPHIFKHVDGDTEGNEALTKGFEFAQDAFKHMNALDPRLTPEQRNSILEKQAVVFNKAAAFDRAWILYGRASKEAKALKKELAQYRASEPGGADGKGKGGLPKEDTLEARMLPYARR
jgi:hypothetical protein